MSHRHDEHAPTLGDTFCLRSTKAGFLAGLVAAMLLSLADAVPAVVQASVVGEVLGLFAVGSAIAIGVMTLQLWRGAKRGQQDGAFWGAVGFVGAVLLGAAIRATALHAGFL